MKKIILNNCWTASQMIDVIADCFNDSDQVAVHGNGRLLGILSKPPEERLTRVNVEDGKLVVASFDTSVIRPQKHKLDADIPAGLLVDQINVMLKEAEERGYNRCVEEGSLR